MKIIDFKSKKTMEMDIEIDYTDHGIKSLDELCNEFDVLHVANFKWIESGFESNFAFAMDDSEEKCIHVFQQGDAFNHNNYFHDSMVCLEGGRPSKKILEEYLIDFFFTNGVEINLNE